MSENSNPMRDVRLALGLTQEEMAVRLGVGYTTVRRCEYEKRVPGTIAGRRAFEQLAREAGIKID